MDERTLEILIQNLHQTPDEKIVEVVMQGHITMDTIQNHVTSDKYYSIQRAMSEIENKVYQQAFEKVKSEIEDRNNHHYQNYSERDFQKMVVDDVISQEHADQLSFLLEQRIAYEISRQDRERILEEMRSGHPKYKATTIQNLLQSNTIDENDLFNLGLNNAQINWIKQFSKERDDNRNEWADLPPLRDSSTDVYLFGPGASGKTTLLAGILYNAENHGMLRPDNTNPAGVKYMDMIKKCIRDGHLPPRTSVDFLNYISVDLRNSRNDFHKINLIEMSGERFERSYNQSDLSNTIGANQYLNNQNRKLIFFVVDYTIDLFKLDAYDDVSNQDVIRNVLQLLAEDGTLKKSDSLNIVVTKSDLISKDYEEAKAGAIQYIQERYRTVYNLCNEYKRDFNIRSFDIIPASLGEFLLPDIYNFDPTSSNKILYKIINESRFERKKRWPF